MAIRIAGVVEGAVTTGVVDNGQASMGVDGRCCATARTVVEAAVARVGMSEGTEVKAAGQKGGSERL
jgi:hypothetical protein